jgi:hypothetical protein
LRRKGFRGAGGSDCRSTAAVVAAEPDAMSRQQPVPRRANHLGEHEQPTSGPVEQDLGVPDF